MLIEEFEARTGFYPTADHYRFIESAYMENNLDKDAFCSAYKVNRNGLAESIARKASIAIIDDMDKKLKEIAIRDEKLKQVMEQLEKEQEWQPYENSTNVKQSDYEKLAASSGCMMMDVEAAKAYIVSEFGFTYSKITIIGCINREEINRHHCIRKKGYLCRAPRYVATDWNYIRFDCAGWHYEINNGKLQPFYC